jgi:Glycosyl hydrolases family 43
VLRPEVSAIPLADDLLSATGERVPLLQGLTDTWEQAPWAPVVENPWVVERDGTYHLLYSGGAYTEAYGMGHATAPSPLGPFTRTTRILAPRAKVTSAGGGMLITGPNGGDWLAYHGRDGDFQAPRTLRLDPVTWPEGGGPPRVDGPSSGPFAVLP